MIGHEFGRFISWEADKAIGMWIGSTDVPKSYGGAATMSEKVLIVYVRAGCTCESHDEDETGDGSAQCDPFPIVWSCRWLRKEKEMSSKYGMEIAMALT